MATTVMVLGVEELRHKWGWFLALGIALIVLGVIALGMISVATLAAVMVLGWLWCSAESLKRCTDSRCTGGVACSCTWLAGFWEC